MPSRQVLDVTRIAVLAAMGCGCAGCDSARLGSRWDRSGLRRFNLFVMWASAEDRFRPRVDLDAFRIDPLPDDNPNATPDLMRLGPTMIAVMVGLEAAITVALALARRLPPNLR
jgi:hypothetical protein